MNQAISSTELAKKVTSNKGLSLVQFKIEWNGACQIMSPIFDELSKSYGAQASFYTVDAENNSTIATEFGINEFPTILLFKDGEIIDHVMGLTPKNMMIAKIENALTLN